MNEILKLPVYYLTNGKICKEEDLISSWGSSCQQSYIVIGKKKPKLYLETWYEEHDCEYTIPHKDRQYLGVIKNIEEVEVKVSEVKE